MELVELRVTVNGETFTHKDVIDIQETDETLMVEECDEFHVVTEYNMKHVSKIVKQSNWDQE